MAELKNCRQALLDIHCPSYLKNKNHDLGAGDIDDLYILVEKCAQNGFRLIQMTPIHDSSLNPSPYMGISSFSLNPIHLSINQLDINKEAEEIIAQRKKKYKLRKNKTIIDYQEFYRFKIKVLEAIFSQYGQTQQIDYKKFDEQTINYAVFRALKNKYKLEWNNWSETDKKAPWREIIAKDKKIKEKVDFYLFCQATLLAQWIKLAKFARERNIHFVIDKPIYPIHDSADVWANQDIFYLNEDGSAKYVSGCDNPRDPFGKQIWDQAVYQFREREEGVIDYIEKSISFEAKISTVIRLDHVIALVWKYYVIDSQTKEGKHIDAIADDLFERLTKKFPNILFIAEDVGFISKLIDRPLEKFGLPGMRSPQWHTRKKYREIEKYPENCLAFSSNHDMTTIHQWCRSLSDKEREYFFDKKEAATINSQDCAEKIIERIFKSKANIAGVSLRDIIHDNRRFNQPGVKNLKNWKLRMPENLEDVDFSLIREIIRESER